KLHEQEVTIVRAHERWHSADQVPAVAQAAKDERADTQRAQRRKAPDHLSGSFDRLCTSKQEYKSRQGAQPSARGEQVDDVGHDLDVAAGRLLGGRMSAP